MIWIILSKAWQHLCLTGVALFFATLIALPTALLLTRSKHPKVADYVIRAAALIQTIPGLAMIALIVVALAELRPYFSLPTTGFLPAVCALTAYGILPILSDTYTGIKEVNPTLVEVAKGMGMTSKQILFLVEIPTAIPFIMAGIRISAVWTIGMATLTSLIGSGGLGDLIMQGLRSMHVDLVLAGTIPAALLAIIFEVALTRIEKWLSLEKQWTS